MSLFCSHFGSYCLFCFPFFAHVIASISEMELLLSVLFLLCVSLVPSPPCFFLIPGSGTTPLFAISIISSEPNSNSSDLSPHVLPLTRKTPPTHTICPTITTLNTPTLLLTPLVASLRRCRLCVARLTRGGRRGGERVSGMRGRGRGRG